MAIGKADLTFGAVHHGVHEVVRGRSTRPNALERVRVHLAAADSQSILAIEDGSCRPWYTDERSCDRDAGAAHLRLDWRAHLRALLLMLGQACGARSTHALLGELHADVRLEVDGEAF